MFRVRFLFRPADPPLGAWGVLGNFATPNVAQDYVCSLPSFSMVQSRLAPPRCGEGVTLGFRFSVNTFAPRPPLPGDMVVVFIAVFSPLRIGFFSFPFYLALVVGFATSPFRGVGVGFEEPHLRHMFYSSSWNRGFHDFFPYFCIYGSSEWASVTVLPWISLKGR